MYLTYATGRESCGIQGLQAGYLMFFVFVATLAVQSDCEWEVLKVEDGLLACQAAKAAGMKACSSEQSLGLERASPAAAVPPKLEDLCTIMCTCGTTGDIKVTHLQLGYRIICLNTCLLRA